MMTISEIAEEHGVSRVSIHTYRRRGTFPQPVQGEGSTRLRFRADEVAAFFAANPKQPGKRTDLDETRPPEGDSVPTTVDPRTAVLSDLCHPEWNPVSESHGMSHDDAVKLLDAYRAAVVAEIVAALNAKGMELSALAEEEMRPSLEERAQTWFEAAEVAQKLTRGKAEGTAAAD